MADNWLLKSFNSYFLDYPKKKSIMIATTSPVMTDWIDKIN